MAAITLEIVKQRVMLMNPANPKGDLRSAILMLSSYFLGTDTTLLAKFAEFDFDYVEEVGQRLREAEIWVGNKVLSDDWFVDGFFCFWSDLLIADGILVRKWVEEFGDYIYEAAPNMAHIH